MGVEERTNGEYDGVTSLSPGPHLPFPDTCHLAYFRPSPRSVIDSEMVGIPELKGLEGLGVKWVDTLPLSSPSQTCTVPTVLVGYSSHQGLLKSEYVWTQA